MAQLTIIEKINGSGEPLKYGQKILIDGEKLIGHNTKSLYIRKTLTNGTYKLSQRGNGAGGAGDLFDVSKEATHEVNQYLFERIKILSEKANAII